MCALAWIRVARRRQMRDEADGEIRLKGIEQFIGNRVRAARRIRADL